MARPTILLFGATGDLAGTKLFAALSAIYGQGGEVPRIVAVGRREHSTWEFQRYVADRVTGAHPDFLDSIEYYRLDMLDIEGYAGLSAYLESREDSACDRVAYLAIPPEHYAAVAEGLAVSGIMKHSEGGFRRIVVEKPFGTDQASAVALDAHLARLYREDQVYRIDHYLGKETVQNVLAFRFANRFFEPLWNKDHIDHVQITVAEEDGIRGRGPYYDLTGAFRDLFQNHVLQLFSVLALEDPGEFSFDAISDKKAEVLRRVRADPALTVFGQYAGYRSEDRVAPDTATETYAMAGLYIDTPKWQGVPFYLRTGKKLSRKISEVSVVFKPSAATLFRPADPSRAENVLTFRIQPDEGISLRMAVKTPRERMAVQPVRMEFCYGMSFRERLPDAYELIFIDVLAGERIHTLRADGIEESWRITDEILATKGSGTLHAYPDGSWGPEEADRIMAAAGRRWLAHESEVCNGTVIEE